MGGITLANNTFEGGAVPHVVANALVLGNIVGVVIHGNVHGHIGNGTYGYLLLNIKRMSIVGNITNGPTGESMYCNTSTGVISANCFHKAIATDGTVVAANNVIG